MSWFNNWFGTPYYKLLYKSRDEAEAQNFISNLILELELFPPKKVLDLACGNGRHSKHLASLGFDVVGLDLSSLSIQEAKKSENIHLHYFEHDMRQAFPEVGFDAVLNLFTSFGYFETMEDNLVTLQNVKQSMNENGLFILDYFNTNKVLVNMISNEEKTIEGVEFEINKFFDEHFIYKKVKVKDGEQVTLHEEKVSRFALVDFEKMFSVSGFEILNTFGDYDLNPYSEILSDRLIIIAKKAIASI